MYSHALTLMFVCASLLPLSAEDPVKDFYTNITHFKPEMSAERAALAQAVKQAYPDQAPARWHRTIESRRSRLIASLNGIAGPKAASSVAAELVQQMGPNRQQALTAARSGNAGGVLTALKDVMPLWEDPLQIFADRRKPLDEAIELVLELDGYNAMYPSDKPVAPFDKAVFIDRFARMVRASTVPKGAMKILEYNEGLSYPSDKEKGQLRVLNDYRMLLGIHPVEMDVRLYLAARDHSRDMNRLKFFSHDSPVPGKRSFSDRAKLAGYNGARAENIARGQKTPEAVHNGWFHSSGHHKNMVGGHSQIGVGEDGAFWTQKFGSSSLLSGGRPPKDVALLIEVLSIADDASPEERFKVAQMAASAKKWSIAVEQLELVLKAEPDNKKAKVALEKIKGQMK